MYVYKIKQFYAFKEKFMKLIRIYQKEKKRNTPRYASDVIINTLNPKQKEFSFEIQRRIFYVRKL